MKIEKNYHGKPYLAHLDLDTVKTEDFPDLIKSIESVLPGIKVWITDEICFRYATGDRRGEKLLPILQDIRDVYFKSGLLVTEPVIEQDCVSGVLTPRQMFLL